VLLFSTGSAPSMGCWYCKCAVKILQLRWFVNIGIIVAITLMVIIIAFIFKKGDNQEIQAEHEEIHDMEKVFFELIQTQNKKPYRLASIYNQYDVMFIKSLFQSEEIPFHIEFEHVTRLIPGLPIPDYNSTFLTILEDDYNDAVKVLEDYISSKTATETTKKDTIRNVVEISVASWRVPPTGENTIVIHYK